MNQEQIKALAKQAGGYALTDPQHAIFTTDELAEFTRLVRESALDEAAEYLDGRQYHGLAEHIKGMK